MELKVFNDPIHGHMEFHPFLVKIIDTPQFQRLRNIKQLGGAYFVYPGASHNRFEHSLGVAYLAGQLLRSLREKLTAERKDLIDERDILCVEIAGLCHDLGHGPFSHMFDRKVIPEILGSNRVKWEHEQVSVQMFEYFVDKLKDDGFDLVEELKKLNESNEGDDLAFIKELILGPNEMKQYKGRPRKKSFLYEIIANKRTGIDVDKFDYFARDCHHLGIKNSFDHCRFIKLARLCEVDGQLQICIRDKEQSNIYELFHTRSCLHRKAYQHKTNKIIELMITEALLKSKLETISEAIRGMQDLVTKMDGIETMNAEIKATRKAAMEAYSKLTDCIFEEILYSSGDDLKEAREILEKVVSRDLYPYLGKTRMTKDTKDVELWKEELAKALPTYQDEQKLTKEDFEIIISAFDFGMKQKNPILNLHFYSKSDTTKAFKLSSEQVSQFLLPANFSEKWINVYCRKTDENTKNLAYRHFYQWCQDNDFLLPPSRTLSNTTKPQPKVFNDPIHGNMEFHPDLVKIIDTPQFQRLRFMKQLGGAYFVYPGASHNCFEHSLGVAHLAGQLVRSLQKKQTEDLKDDVKINERDILCVEIAGLCHDLGHGPFSEVFDNVFFQDICPDLKWQRSTVSAKIFRQIANKVDLEDRDKTFIEEMIKGIDVKEKPKGRPKSKYFLYDIVNNKRNGVDVNVFDCVARDCYHLGLKTNFDHQRFIRFATPNADNSQICIRDKVMGNIYDLFHTTAALYNKAYQHKVTMKIQLMMSDAIKKEMQHTWKNELSEVTEQRVLDFYTKLTDSLFGERSAENDARNILERIHSRKLYTYLNMVEPQETQETSTINEPVKKTASKLGVKMEDTMEGIYVSTLLPQTIYGMSFYTKSGKFMTREEIDKKRPQISIPESSHKQWIHVFYKGTRDLTEAQKKQKFDKTLECMSKKRKLSQESIHTSCVKFMKCSFY